ncbi:MAG: galactose-1-phosphate uridylyltransferase [Methanomicrobiales archaeon]|nr:galactose-1-phosphate uridylyltransferase [Methanomicrobiales archaeon]
MFFSCSDTPTRTGSIQVRREILTGYTCRISPERLRRGIDQAPAPVADTGGCPFCPGAVESTTPVFQDGSRIYRGESVTFPNLYPFARRHTVTVITRAHAVDRFSRKQIADALDAQILSLSDSGGYASINWNYLPSAGASLAHPHLQGIADTAPSARAGRYIRKSSRYRADTGACYWDHLREHEARSERYCFGDELVWAAGAVPVGEKEMRGYLPVRTIAEFSSYTDMFAADLLRIIDCYRKLGTHAFNMALFFDKEGADSGFRAFASVIARINPNPASTSDSAFMERLHLEPVIMTLPEELGRIMRDSAGYDSVP